MKNTIFVFTLFSALALLTACSQNTSKTGAGVPEGDSQSSVYAGSAAADSADTSVKTSDDDADSADASGTDLKAPAARTITDIGGNQVTLPAASDIKRIVILSPPVMSFAVEMVPDTKMIAGITPMAFTNANTDIIDKVFPEWKSVDTSFLNANFAVNTESLLKLRPDIIFYYGTMQKQGLENIGIPSVDFLPKEQKGAEALSVAWDHQLREIFELDSSNSQQKEWNRVKEKAAKLLANNGETKSGLCVFSDAAGKIMVSGKDSFDAYAQSYFDIAGIRNAAADLDGTTEVSMEKIYQWDPDLIVVFQNAPAKDILDNSIEGQDWSLLKAWKNKAVYDVPRTTFAWISPCADASLLPLWLVSKAYPELMSDQEMRTEISDFYERNYGIRLTGGDLDSILDDRKAPGL